MASIKCACVVALLCLVVATAPTAHAITCGQVASSLTSCIPFITKGGIVPPSCCAGVKSLNAAAKTTPDRQAVCNCLKSEAGRIGGFNANNAAILPGKCGVSIPYKISTSTNCASIKF
ncbi:non-specific lipid-transfer protein 1 [Vigna radiata var. radiata]|uniref:Non-specific lipid-transfer protein n=2 Tax=Vigna radiata TaxID=157791 RepID=A0A1S3T9B2_VIGRR|nr:non-specific lipid-transfer protein 1 [Vigna radiata var. radiata]AAQ74627.1 lipid transfer protein I [Vigna radiata]